MRVVSGSEEGVIDSQRSDLAALGQASVAGATLMADTDERARTTALIGL